MKSLALVMTKGMAMRTTSKGMVTISCPFGLNMQVIIKVGRIVKFLICTQ
jgi:hypothetical protein